MLNNGRLLQNRYLIESLIGAGGMGSVYLAIDQRFGAKVAVKKSDSSASKFSNAFEREAQLLNSLHHPALPHVTDYFAEGDGQFLVMQYIAGEDLSETIERQGAFPVVQVLQWADELLDTLNYLHTQKFSVVHRDVKPQNLKLSTSGKIILLDFGLAKGNPNEFSKLTETKSVFGYSRSYAPLEQIQGAGTDVRSDLYSLAATLYHLLTGQPPLDALTRAKAVLSDEADSLHPVNALNANVSVKIAEILHQSLSLNANARPKTAAEMRIALKEAALSMLNAKNQSCPPVLPEPTQLKLNLKFLNDEAVARTVTERNQTSEITTETDAAANGSVEEKKLGNKDFSSQSIQLPLNSKKPIRPLVANSLKVAAATLVLCGGAYALFNNKQSALFQKAGTEMGQLQTVTSSTAKSQPEIETTTTVEAQNVAAPQTNSLSAEDSGKNEILLEGSSQSENTVERLSNDQKSAAVSPPIVFNKNARAVDSKEKFVPPAQTAFKPKTPIVAAINDPSLKPSTTLEVTKPQTAAKPEKESRKGIKGFFGKIGSGVMSVPKSVFGKKKDKPD